MTGARKVAVAVSIVLTVASIRAAAGAGSCTVKAELRPKTITVLPGVAVELTVTFRNVSGAAVALSSPSVLGGTVTVEIADEQSPAAFKSYQGPRWGLKDGRRRPRQLAPDATFDLPLKIQYHSVLNKLDPDPTDILTPFALSTPGKYLLRASYEMDPTCTRVSAQPISVQVLAPGGEDLLVWNAIKDCQQCAYLLDTGHAMSDAETQQVATLLRGLTKQYPRSRYAKIFRKQIDALDEKDRRDSTSQK